MISFDLNKLKCNIKPSGDEIIKNSNMVENACYW